MRVYEGLFLVGNSDANKDQDGIIATIKQTVEKHGGEVHMAQKWDERKLAFEINKMRRGTYFLTYFSLPTDKLGELNRDFRLTETVQRHMITRDADEVLPKHKVEHSPSEYIELGHDGKRDGGDKPQRGERGDRGDRGGDRGPRGDRDRGERRDRKERPSPRS